MNDFRFGTISFDRIRTGIDDNDDDDDDSNRTRESIGVTMARELFRNAYVVIVCGGVRQANVELRIEGVLDRRTERAETKY